MFGISLFDYDEVLVIEEGLQFTGINPHIESLKPYAGECLVVGPDWIMDVWSQSGVNLDQIRLIDCPDFQKQLLEKLNERSAR